MHESARIMKKPTEARIKQEIQKLLTIQPHVVQRSAFGDDHHAAIDAQIAVLEQRMTDDDVYENYPFDNPDAENEAPENVHSAALEAAKWLAGESDEKDLVSSWKELTQ